MTAQLISGRDIAATIRAELKDAVQALKEDSGVTPGLATVLVGADPASPAVIAANREAIVERYGRPQARRRLLTVYEEIVRHPVRHRIDKSALQRSFFDLDRFSLLKWGAYEA